MLFRESRALLLVEDDAALGALLADFLAREGWAVLNARAGWEAKRLLEEAPEGMFESLVTDLRMPGFDGISLLSEVFARPRGVKRIVVTSMWWREEERRFREMLKDAELLRSAGVSLPTWRLLEKPFGPLQLRRALGE